jgi:2-amino-4-hydroxy-6-hydroxymethyldihydropteridine diphosphokinase
MIAADRVTGTRETSALSTVAAVLLGSNIRTEFYLPAAVRELSQLGEIVAVSSVWQTAPVGDEQQADFCNAAVAIRTSLMPECLVQALHDIENRLDRVRDPRNKNAARTIDLDLVVYGDGASIVNGQVLPAAEICERVFVAVPLNEVLDGFRWSDGEPLSEMALRLVQRDGAALRLNIRADIQLSHSRVGHH